MPLYNFLFLTTPPENSTFKPESFAYYKYSSNAYPLVSVYDLTTILEFFPFQTNKMYL